MEENNQIVPVLKPAVFSENLIQTLLRFDDPNQRKDAKLDFAVLVSDLMPKGVPNYLEIIRYPMIKDLLEIHSKKRMLIILVALIKDFCASINVVRNMNEEQIVEASIMLIEECGNLRLEDYVIMFSLAKRGVLFKFYDHLDIQVITSIADSYYAKRSEEKHKMEEAEEMKYIQLGDSTKVVDTVHIDDKRLEEGINRIAASIEEIKNIIE